MVERRTGPTPVPSCRHAVGRLVDGDTVPHRPRPTQRGMSRVEEIGWGVVPAIVVLVIVLRASGVLS